MALTLAADELAAAERELRRALASGGHGGLEVLGYGEISTVIGVTTSAGRFALKRLPPFGTRPRYDAYRALFAEYLERLAAAGMREVPSELRVLEADDGTLVAYCVQPAVAPERLGPAALAAGDARELFTRVLDHVMAAVSPQVGLDAQIANWVLEDDGWAYLDVTTPLLRDAGGRDRLDADLFLAALPWALRGLVRRFMLRAITDTYFDPRRVMLDVLGNLYKERLERHVPAFVEIANRRLARPLSVPEVAACYRRDARLWASLLALRRADRFWQLRVRRRPYPFLLPGRIER